MSHLALLLSFSSNIPKVLSESVNCYLPLFLCTGGSRNAAGTGRFSVRSIGGSKQQPIKVSISWPLLLGFPCTGPQGLIALLEYRFFLSLPLLIIRLGSAPAIPLQANSRAVSPKRRGWELSHVWGFGWHQIRIRTQINSPLPRNCKLGSVGRPWHHNSAFAQKEEKKGAVIS